ncbi:MAG: hypothetical protein OJF49_003736 [Ktedonobacterales bacterium]|jgi:hypothetical protein|nr:MAG: hypothetical protein OJF49_003736 [Ktedonobacterales bacterium]
MDDEFSSEGLTDEYAALSNAPKVMEETLKLLDELHKAVTQFGNAIVAAGLPAREWLADDARLSRLSDQFPDITLDALVSRAAEFSAGNGPHWLRGDATAFGEFLNETLILLDVVRALRIVAQRLRLVPARERSDAPLERALADGRAGAKLDSMARALGDLEALGPFIRPLTREEWRTLDAPPAAKPKPAPTSAPQPAVPPAPGEPAVAAVAAAPSSPPPATDSATDEASRPLRLRDYLAAGRQSLAFGAATTSDSTARPRSLAATLTRTQQRIRQQAQRLRPFQWIVVAVAVLSLAGGTALLAYATHSAAPTPIPTPVSHLAVTPTKLALTCTGKSAALTLTLKNTGATLLNWSTKAPSGLSLSAMHGTLKPGATATITVKVTSRKAAHGTFAITSADGSASVAYTVTCS